MEARTAADAELKWYRPCFICRVRSRCRKEKVERGSKKCLKLLNKEMQRRS
ncbi:MAG TPA: hypothetical protein PKX52_04465 [Methanomassiliicoccaceae archaeon]|nr:hypothetical protein [Euryarchaeota archaeon]HOQ25275.1 hypothetical protein [Methanomassiliicoccaceae archaeon]HPT74137.1 hypothetical protein [Methanomassiliicoccaceae archaeon]HQD87287.1 hypothetical protein [Methanomassiliicoccaceae archaeon]